MIKKFSGIAAAKFLPSSAVIFRTGQMGDIAEAKLGEKETWGSDTVPSNGVVAGPQ